MGRTLKGLNYIYRIIDDALLFNQSNAQISSIPFHINFLYLGDFRPKIALQRFNFILHLAQKIQTLLSFVVIL